MPHLISLAVAATLVLAASAPAHTRTPPASDPNLVASDDHDGAFDREVALGTYFSRWSGSYAASGVGGRLRWEPLDALGVEVFTELLSVDVPAATRFDLPSGFSLYVPIRLTEGLRIRPLAGLCTMFSVVASDAPGVPASEDVRFGVHAGIGAELAVASRWSVFVDAVYQGYFGHAHDAEAWTSSLSDEISREDSLQLGLGLQVHL